MTFHDYQIAARKTAIYPTESPARYAYPALGLASEAGEVAGKLKKVIRDNGGEVGGEVAADLQAELGDVLWYVAQLATELGIDLDAVAAANIDKLASRAARGVLGGSGDKR